MPNTDDGQEKNMVGIFHNALHISYERACAVGNYLIDCVSVKKNLRIEESFHQDDEIINGFCLHAMEYVSDYTGISDISFGNEIDGVKNYSLGMAVLILASYYYENGTTLIEPDSKASSMLKSILDLKKINW